MFRIDRLALPRRSMKIYCGFVVDSHESPMGSDRVPICNVPEIRDDSSKNDAQARN